MKQYDIVVIGAGGAGITAALTSAGFGKKVALIDKNLPGGECTWSGCIPSKSLIHMGKRIYEAKKLDFISETLAIEIDSNAVMDYVRNTIQNVYSEETPEVLRQKGVDFYRGIARFESANTLRLESQTIEADRFIIATGTKPRLPKCAIEEGVEILTNENIFKLEAIPKSMAIVGSGPIAIEMAQAFNRLGCEVSVLLRRRNILKKEEAELSRRLKHYLEDEGVNFVENFNLKAVFKTEGGVKICGEDEKCINAQRIFVAIGRYVNLEGLLPDDMGIEWDFNGIKANKYMRTSINNIYACGDVVGPYRFSHMAEYQGVIAARNAILPWLFNKKVKYDRIPWVTFTDPELSRFGLTEIQAEERLGRDKYKVYEYDYKNLDRAKTDETTNGYIKVILDKKNYILGVHILGNRSGELLHEFKIIAENNMKLSKIKDIIHAYPTYSDAIRQIGKKVYLDELLNNRIVSLFRKSKDDKN